ncbi:MAG TPA: S8 family serine peptidase [Gaiellaceae bacterium]
MRTRSAGVVAFFGLIATIGLVAAGGQVAGQTSPHSLASWVGLAGGERPRVAVGQRMLVVLRRASLAARVAAAGGRATGTQERQWTAAVLAGQNLLISRLGLQGVRIRTEFRYARVLNGFSAPLDARSLTLLERAPEVAGIYPVRTAYPATLPQRAFDTAGGHRPTVSLPQFDGRGITIALLDTGVDRAQPFLRGRIAEGVDIVGGSDDALAAAKPDSRSELERHGTEMAGLLVGAGGPEGLAGIAPGASVLPVRVGGWQRDATGAWSIYARSDQILAGLESAVDPNGDGDAHDAARVALVALAAPFAAFDDDPLSRAVAGARRLDTLVVVPAGNDGRAGPSFGVVSGPGGAPQALTVGAVDGRRTIERVRVVVRVGLNVVLDEMLPLGGAVAPAKPLSLAVATPRAPSGQPPTPALDDFFDARGVSRVAGRAALVAAGEAPQTRVEQAARAGAAAVLVYGGRLPGGALGLDPGASAPTVALPPRAAATILAALGQGGDVGVSIGRASTAPNPEAGGVAPFSSTGLSFDGRVKPNVVAPGVALATAEPGADATGAPRFGTVNGSSAAAAVVAGAAARLAEARPDLDAGALAGLLAESARPIAGEPVTSQGAGLVDAGAAAAGEVAVEPWSLAFGRARGTGWHGTQTLLVRNLSTRPVGIRIRIERATEGAAAVRFSARPAHRLLKQGESVRIPLRARIASALQGTAPATGAVVVDPIGDQPLRIPWAITFGRPRRDLLGDVALKPTVFEPSDVRPALLSVVAGRVLRVNARDQIQPLDRLDITLWNSKGSKLGLLARLRDVLPGSYQFGLTGRSPAGALLDRGRYRLKVVGYPTAPGPATVRWVGFRIR